MNNNNTQKISINEALDTASNVLEGPVGDLLTGDSMADTGAYDALNLLKKAKDALISRIINIEMYDEYLYIKTIEGDIQIKFEGEGIVVDLISKAGESIGSTYAYTDELKEES